MFIVQNYTLAILCCFITMLCWGSWANTQKLVTGKWRFELFYWDYVIGIVLFSLIAACTLGSYGTEGRPFLTDFRQASWSGIGSAFLGGIIFNLAKPAQIVETVDTTAAGDVFNGALAVYLSEGKDLVEAVRLACEAAAVSVTRLGAQSSIPYRRELLVRKLQAVKS